MAQSFGDAALRPDLHDDLGHALVQSADAFKAVLDTKHVASFEKATSHGVYADLHTIQSQQQEKRTMMNLSRIQMFLEGMAGLQDILSDLEPARAVNIMACVWGPMRFLLNTTNINDKAFDHMLEAYQRLGAEIPPLNQYRHFLAGSQDAKTCLLHLYRDVLEFHRLAYKLFSLRTTLWTKLHRASWKDLETTFAHLEETLRLHAGFIRTHGRRDLSNVDSGFASPPTSTAYANDAAAAAAAADIRRGRQQYEAAYAAARRRFRRAEQDRKTEQKTKILKWIAAPNKTGTLHESFVQKRALCPDSGRWLYKRYDAVSNWMREDPPRDSTLWVHGPRGMGKTILASLVVVRLRELAREGRIPEDAQVAYFYCQERDQDMATYLGILRGILHQFVNNNAAILPLCADKIANSGGSSLSSPEAVLPLLEAFFDINPRQYLVVDGLDECDATTEVQQAVGFLTAQVGRCEDVSQGSLRVLFTSQATADVRRVMAKHGVPGEAGREVELDARRDNAQDIRAYVRKRLAPEELSKAGRPFNLSDDNVQDIEDQVTAQSEGLFLYAELAMEYLVKQLTKKDLLERVRPGMLPDTISKLYDTLLGTLKDNLTRLSSNHWAKAKLLLGFLVCAHRTLKWHEIQAILAFDRARDTVDFDLNMIRTENVADFLGSLVQVLPGDNIRLIHSTAKKYLVNTEHINAELVQCDLATICLRYLSLRCFAAEDYTEAERLEHIPLGYFSFQDYAVSQWYNHVASVIKSCKAVFLPSPPPPPPSSSSSTSFASSHNVHYQHQHNPVVFDAAAEQTQRDDHAREFVSALARFAAAYGADLRSASPPHPDLPLDDLAAYAALPFYPALFRVWNHIYAHQTSPIDERNKIGLPRLEAAVQLHRDAIERDFRPASRAGGGTDTMEQYYGPNLFKCQRLLCRFFHQGFDARRDRDAHLSRHDRPYRCPVDTCGFAPVGFSSNKDRERHVRNYHPELSDAPSAFLQLSRRVEAARFRCKMCPKTFTRNINLKGHERSHFGERPYACPNCGKAFARLNDCRRHERIHARKGS
ncbi:uncharacterized protein GLRG_10521 [Colletotrichum graminicola M1.001]|uniref:C2H2-type domain-containing protein n=1 Tax=Colletotrichum graminicola (strain M1.001 / M2 / FGSC 10212) TaxID=645133 RepID=E3QWY9_COLGM|nr:uncharacterized protein GLRG_10521 [Colletotrichum graminicola M1.001]EFQ35377.1 hypothetical protein GLRG_10521 [Colletotrichum graminicola M1.001]